MNNYRVIDEFRLAGDSDMQMWLLSISPVPESKRLRILFYPPQHIKSGDIDLLLYSYDNNISVRIRCRPEDCDDCPNRYRCIHARRIIDTGTVRIEEEFSGVRYLVTEPDFVSRTVADRRKAKVTQNHIKLLLEDLTPLSKEDIEDCNREGFFPHPSTIYPIFKLVDCWAMDGKF